MVDSSEIGHHVQHLSGINGSIIPAHPIAGLHKVATDLPFGHAAHELLPGGLPGGTELNTCLGSVVEKLIVADPQGSVPGFVVCPTVVGGVGCQVVDGVAHVGSFGMG